MTREENIMTLDQLFKDLIKEIKKMSEEEKRDCREHLNWSLLYDKKIDWEVIH
jgi:hypothetical protein